MTFHPSWTTDPIIAPAGDGGYIIGFAVHIDTVVRDPIKDTIKDQRSDWDFYVTKIRHGNVEWVYQNNHEDNDVLVDLAVDSSGNVVIVGTTWRGADWIGSIEGPKDLIGGEDLWVVKLNPDGMHVWDKVFGGSNRDFVKSVAVGADRIFVSSHTLSSDHDVPENKGNADGWILALDENGEKLWSKVLGGAMVESMETIAAMPDGGCIGAGFSLSADGDFDVNMSSYDAWVMRLDATGEITWKTRLASSGLDRFTKSVVYGDNIYLLGDCSHSDGNIDTSTWEGGEDYWLTKVGIDGNILSQNFYGSDLNEVSSDIAFIPSARQFVIAGGTDFHLGDGTRGDVSNPRSSSQSVSTDWWIVLLDTNLTIVEEFIYGGRYRERCSSVAASGNTFMVGGSTLSGDGDVRDFKGQPWINNERSNIWLVEFSLGSSAVPTREYYSVEPCVRLKVLEDGWIGVSAHSCLGVGVQAIDIYDIGGKRIPAETRESGQEYAVKAWTGDRTTKAPTPLFVVVRLSDGRIVYEMMSI